MEAEQKQDYLGDLRKKNKPELLELLERQQKLLANKKFVGTLPDKGVKLTKCKEQIEQTLAWHDRVAVAADAFSKLSIRTRRNDDQRASENGSDDDDDELEKDPSVWETLATNEVICKKETYVKSAAAQKPEFYASLTEAIDNVKQTREPFKAHKAKHCGSQDAAPKSKSESKKAYEEESAVRYPTGPHKETKILSLEQSLKLEKEHMDAQKELQWKQAAESLKQKMGNNRIGSCVPENPSTSMEYRENQKSLDYDSDDDDEDGGNDANESDESDVLD